MSDTSNEPTPPSPPAILPDHSFAMEVPGTRYARAFRSCWFLFWGVVCPAIFLAFAAWHDGMDMWQSGSFGTYALLVFQGSNMWMLYVLLAFSACGLTAMAFQTRTHLDKNWVQLAVLSGALLWLEVWIAWCGGVSHEFGVPSWLFLTAIVSPIVGVIFIQPFVASVRLGMRDPLNPRYAPPSKLHYVIVICLYGILSIPLLGAWFLCIICAAPLAVSAYFYASYEILAARKAGFRIRLSAILIAFAWLSAHFAAWRIAIIGAIREYNQLPTEAPQACFVASAAARGHGGFVHSWRVPSATGERVAITRQMQLLKALEIVLKQTSPNFHRLLRCVYNRVGPPIARRITNRWQADCVYLLLKPPEWVAWLVVRGMARVPETLVASLYSCPKGERGA